MTFLPGLTRGAPLAPLVLDPDATALIDRMAPTPPYFRRALINATILALKAENAWDRMRVFYVNAAHSEQAALLNWKGSFYDLAIVGSVAFEVDRGFTGDASTGYLSTGWNPTVDPVGYAVDDVHLAGWSNTPGIDSGGFVGLDVAEGLSVLLRPLVSGDICDGRVNKNSTVTAPNTDALGDFVYTRSAGVLAFNRNGAPLGFPELAGGDVLPNAVLTFLRAHIFSRRQIAAGSIGLSLTAQHVLARYLALRDYMTGVGVL